MIASLQFKERTNRSHQTRGAPVPSAHGSSACFIRVFKRDQLHIALISFRPQTPLRPRKRCEAALRRSELLLINHRSLEA